MSSKLTPNAIRAINGGDLDLKPLVQVLDVKPVPGAHERYRILVSDGSSAQQALLAAQLNRMVKEGNLKKGSVVQLIEYVCSTVQSKRIIIVLNLETVIVDSEIVGNPKIPPEFEPISKDLPSSSSAHSSTRTSHNSASNSIATANIASSSVVESKNEPLMPNHVVQQPYRPPPNYKSRGAIMKNEAPARIIPIAAINPYQGRWAIKARVIAKGDLRRYNNARGDGKVFSFDLLDSDGGEIRVTCFNAMVDKFYDIIETGKIYLISKGSLKPAQKNFNHLNNEWEIFLESTSTVELCPNEQDSIPTQQFKFKPIFEIENTENNTIIDIIGIVTSVNPTTTILRKNGMETQRRIVSLKDVSGRSVELTLWGDFCNKEGRELQEIFDSGVYPVLAVKAGKVSDFSGKSVGTIFSTQLFVNPSLPEADNLRKWFDGGGKDAACEPIAREGMPALSRNEIRKTVSQIKDEGLGRGVKPDWVTIKATISFIKTDSFCYTACPLMIGDRQCNKKVTKVASGNWCCDRCDKEFEECEYRYLLQAQMQDHTGVTWVTAFQESAEEIIGCSAKELHRLKFEEPDDSRFEQVIRRSLFEQYLFKLKIKEELYGDEQRVKISVIKTDKVNASIESRYLLELIERQTALLI